MKILYRCLLVFFFLVWLAAMYLVLTTTQDSERALTMTKWMAQYAINPYFGLFFIAGIAAIMLAFWWPTWQRTYRQNRLAKRLNTEGVLTKALIIQLTDTRITVNKNPRIRFRVRILDQEAEFELTVSRIHLPNVGDWIEVRYDPQNPRLAVPALY